MSSYLRRFSTALCLIFLFIGPVAGQSAKVPAGNLNTKLVVINTLQFEDSVRGVRKIVAAMKTLNAEYIPKRNELLSLSNRMEALVKEAKNSSGPTASAKYEEAQKLERDLKFKQESYQQQFERRRQQLLQPIYTSLANALSQWCKANGYTLVVDISKDDKGLFVWMEDGAADATTTAFVHYYNTLPSP